MLKLYFTHIRAIATFLYILSKLVDRLPVFEREFDVSDPLIKHHHTKQQ